MCTTRQGNSIRLARPLADERVVNIWTHVVGASAALVAGVLRIQPQAPHLESIGLESVFLAGAVVCLSCSAFFHTVTCHSMEVSHRCNKLDYVGIVALISGTFVPIVGYGFSSSPLIRNVYLGVITLSSISGCPLRPSHR